MISNEHYHFVTGRLAEESLRKVVRSLADDLEFSYTIDVLPITAAALMTPQWIAKHIDVSQQATRIIIPGYCQGDLAPLAKAAGVPVDVGPRDLRQLPRYFSQPAPPPSYGEYDLEILAEINECPRKARAEILAEAHELAASGADVIDVGCLPGEPWSGVADVVKELRDVGLRVSIDSLNPAEIVSAVAAGAELVLSVNSTNREQAVDWGVEVVAIPDVPATLDQLDETVEWLATAGVPLRIDPILEPMAFGFAASLGRYLDVRGRYPDAEMMMGVGNLTELTDVDSAGVNVVLLGFCQELGIRSVLTTQVINWARTSVRECDLGRRLMHYAVSEHVLPKHVEPRLIMLRDPEVNEPDAGVLADLAAQIRDHSYRIFASHGEVHLVGRELHLHDPDPFVVIRDLLQDPSRKPLDASHAFYLGYEMSKAVAALTLGKQYEQDEALQWGFATRAEAPARLTDVRSGKAGPENTQEQL